MKRTDNKKRMYRATHLKAEHIDKASKAAQGKGRLVIATDVAKHKMVSCVMDERGISLALVRWDPAEDREVFVGLVSRLQSQHDLVVVMESTGTYGDALREWMEGLGVPVYRVDTRIVQQMARLEDHVPSCHDGKDAIVLGHAHWLGKSALWLQDSEEQRERKILLALLRHVQKQEQQSVGVVEGLVASYWPGFDTALDLKSATSLAVLEEFGGPVEVRAQEEPVRARMRQVGGPLLKEKTIDAVLVSARQVARAKPLLPLERRVIAQLVQELRGREKETERLKKQLEELGQKEPVIVEMAQEVGLLTATVLFTRLGDPRGYPNVRAYLKAIGLTLVECSSGQFDDATLRISKTGPAQARQLLYLAVLRWIQKDPLARAWYQHALQRNGGVKLKALIGLMRKLAAGLWHVARGQVFDSRLLFDTRRLGLQTEETPLLAA